jgi:hypothetical protein
MKLSEFQTREEVRAVLENVGRTAPSLAPLRDGIVIDGSICRLTIGVLMLLQIVDNDIFFSEEEDMDAPISVQAMFECFWLCNEDNLDTAITVADDRERLDKIINKLVRSYGKRRQKAICSEVSDWIRGQVTTIEQISSGDEGEETPLPSDWWVEAVDTLASTYGWSEEFILWKLPVVRAMKYQEAIAVRLEGEQRSSDIDDDAIKALKLLEEEKANG